MAAVRFLSSLGTFAASPACLAQRQPCWRRWMQKVPAGAHSVGVSEGMQPGRLRCCRVSAGVKGASATVGRLEERVPATSVAGVEWPAGCGGKCMKRSEGADPTIDSLSDPRHHLPWRLSSPPRRVWLDRIAHHLGHRRNNAATAVDDRRAQPCSPSPPRLSLLHISQPGPPVHLLPHPSSPHSTQQHALPQTLSYYLGLEKALRHGKHHVRLHRECDYRHGTDFCGRRSADALDPHCHSSAAPVRQPQGLRRVFAGQREWLLRVRPHHQGRHGGEAHAQDQGGQL